MWFFSSRRRHTRYWRDWSSDVCSSDLRLDDRARELLVAGGDHVEGAVGLYVLDLHVVVAGELSQGAELVDQLGLKLVRRHTHFPPPEADQVPIPRVDRSGGHTSGLQSRPYHLCPLQFV